MRPENRPTGNSVLLHPSSLKRSEVAEAGKVGRGGGGGPASTDCGSNPGYAYNSKIIILIIISILYL
jgi:hypothetical protein